MNGILISDVNECLDLVAAKCNGAQMECYNYPGGFDCTCKTGYKMNAAMDKCEGEYLIFIERNE